MWFYEPGARSDLKLQAQADLLGIGQAGFEIGALVEQAGAGVEALDDVIQLELDRALRVLGRIRNGRAVVELGAAIFAQQLELADADLLREQVSRQGIPAAAVGVAPVEAAGANN